MKDIDSEIEYINADYSTYSIYSHPERYGLEQVGMIDFSDGNYVFDYRVVWKDKENGELYTARDSGCSCPSPFENLTLKDLEDFSLSYLIDEAIQKGSDAEYYQGSSTSEWIRTLRRLAEE